MPDGLPPIKATNGQFVPPREQKTDPPSKAILSTRPPVSILTNVFATLFAGTGEVIHMIQVREVTLGDLLLLFLYLEVLAMVGIYLKSGKLPIRFPIYIAIVALARLLILDLKSLNEWEMIAIGGTITLLSIAVLILRYGHFKMPYILNRRKDD